MTGSSAIAAAAALSLSSVTADRGLEEDAAEEFLLLDARSVEHPESLELIEELLGLDFPDFSVVMDDEPECRRESALLSFFLRPCRDFNLGVEKVALFRTGFKSDIKKSRNQHFVQEKKKISCGYWATIFFR